MRMTDGHKNRGGTIIVLFLKFVTASLALLV
jgi:hypothetical protein